MAKAVVSSAVNAAVKGELLREQRTLKKVLADIESRTGPVQGVCAMQERLREIESRLAGEAASPLKATDWIEVCHICGRRCWL